MNTKFSTKGRTHKFFIFTFALALSLIVVFTGACNKGGGSPTDALKAYYDAGKKKDIETAKKYLSKGTLQVMEDSAKAQGKTVDQMFKDNADRDAQMPTPEFSNEKINGDTATVDIKGQGMTVTMPMVKEDGQWKLAIDKMMEEMGKPHA
ncbi:MAG: hypothetical protein QOC96_2296 [Acidobacteriota bacterium]|jgi:flagellar hook-associated protein FlgK|nr:hypothetical protein [Acidobacteriota bacterium]